MTAINDLKLRFGYAKQNRQRWDNIMSECYRYAIPHRDTWYGNNKSGQIDPTIYDSTAVDSVSNLANTLHLALTPPESQWIKFAPGTDVPGMDKDRVQDLLDHITDRFFQLLNSTNFDTEINQCYTDITVGTASLGIRDYDDPEAPATFVAVPPNETYICEGRQGFIDTTFREFEMEPRQIKITWPKATYNADAAQQRIQYNGANGTQKIKVIECTYWNFDTKKAEYVVWLDHDDTEIYRKELLYNNWLTFRWGVVSGEMMGRGPVMKALPDIRTLNKTVELILKNGSLAMAGVYTAVDDGVLNPDTTVLAPGVIIPVAANGGNFGRSLDALPRAGDFDVSQLILKEMRDSVRKKLYDNDLAPLDQAVRSSREVAMRQANLARSAGPNFGRLKTELIANLVNSLKDMWSAKGLLPPFKIDGKLITIVHQSPIAREQNDEDLAAMDGYLQRLNMHTMGFASMAIKPADYAYYVAEKSGIPFKVIQPRDAIDQASQAMTQQIAQGTPAGAQAVKQMTG